MNSGPKLTFRFKKINIILITQASSEHSICFGIAEGEAKRAKKAIDKTFEYEIELEHQLSDLEEYMKEDSTLQLDLSEEIAVLQ